VVSAAVARKVALAGAARWNHGSNRRPGAVRTPATPRDAFAELPARVRDRLVAAGVACTFARNQALFRAGDPGDALYYIVAGRVRVSRESAGRIELLHGEQAGGILGAIPVFGNAPYPATAIAVEPTRCVRLSKAAVDRLLLEHPELARYAIAQLANRAQTLLRRIDELTATTVVARVARVVHARATSGGAFTLGMSQAMLAEEIGTAREVIVRAIGALVNAGAIARAGRARFVVRDAKVLEAIACLSSS
jgi:CRP/FNR family transcriptional regulator